MFQTSNILYTLRVAKGSKILAFENSTGKDNKRQSELQTQRMGERGRDERPVRGEYDPPLPAAPAGTAVLGVEGNSSKPARERGNG